MSRFKRLIVEIHGRSFWQVPADASAARATGCGSCTQCQNKRRLVRGRMATVYLARDLKGARQLVAEVLQPVTEKLRARE